jgi:NitT/TauT family transport system substrate-binding protein
MERSVDRPRPRPRAGLFSALLLVGLALIAACASPQGQGGAPSQSTGGAQPAAKPAEITKVPLILNFRFDPTFAPLLYGTEKGFFREQGVELDIVPGRGSDLAMQQINENKLQFAFTDLLTYLLQRAKGETPTTAVMSYFDSQTIGVVANAPVSRPQDLSGRSWGTVPFSSGRFLLPLTLKSNGVDPSTVQVELMDFGVLYPSLLEGKIDSAEAHIASSLVTVQQAAEKVGKQLYYAPLSDWGLRGYAKIIIVRDDLISSNPDLVRRMTTGLMRSLDEARAKASDDEIVNLVMKYDVQYQRDQVLPQWIDFKQALKNPGPIDPAVVQANLNYMAEGQDVRTDLRPEQLFTNEFLPTP